MTSTDDVSDKRVDLESCPPGSNGRDLALFNLAAALHNRFTKGRNFGDLDEAFALLHNHLELSPSGHPDRASALHLLALCLFNRYDDQGRVTNLEENVTLGRHDLRRGPQKHARTYDLEEAIDLYRVALELHPSGHPNRPSLLHKLAVCFSYRYDNRGEVADLEEAVTLGRAAIELHLPGHPDRPASLYSLAYDLRRRFEKHARMYDLEEAIKLHRAALELCPPGYPNRSSMLHGLALCLSDRYNGQGTVADLEEAVTIGREVLELCLPGHLDRAVSLYSLAYDLRSRFEKHARMNDLEEAIELYRAALELCPRGHRNRSSLLHGLALCLSDRYNSQGTVADLEEAVTLGRAVLELCQPGHPDYAACLHSLACDLRRRFEKHARMYDVEEAIELHRAVLKLSPIGHPNRSSSLRGLALCLADRYDSQGTATDLEEAVTLGRAALELTLPGHPSRASSLHDLAEHLANRFRHQSIVADLNEAIALEQEALQLFTPGDPSYTVSRRCLMTFFQMKSDSGVAIRSPSAPGVMHVDVKEVIYDFILNTIKMMPTRLLHTLSGVLCNRDVQMSHFRGSQQYRQLLSACRTCPPDQHTKLILTTISGYFQFVTFSHRWGVGEPLLRDIEGHSIYGMSTEGGFGKLQAFCLRAREQNYFWAWSDTCCIDKDSSAELQEAIGSMFKWYRRSALTIVHLSDVPETGSFGSSKWFRRGWTLQELLAPKTILFYTQNWSLYRTLMCSNHKADVAVLEELEVATGIESRFLTDFSPGMDDARSRLQWASSRCTTRPEDIAYSLFGIFDLHLPILYGESAEKALGRLLTEIISQSRDISVLDWVGEASPFHSCFPAHITSFQTLLLSPSQPHTEELSLTKNPQSALSTAPRKLYRSLAKSPPPQFINRRLTLPSITHRVRAIQLQAEDPLTPSYTYKIRASGLRTLEITLRGKLEDAAMKQGALQLVRPLNTKLLSPSAEPDATTEYGLLSTLGSPFHALLLVRLLHNEYKRIASSIPIVAEPMDSGSIVQSRVKMLNIV